MELTPSASRSDMNVDQDAGYSLQQMREAKEDIKKGLTYTEATEGRQLCRATLHAHVHNEYPDDQKPKRGPKFKFIASNELNLVAYTNYCWKRNFPRTEEMLKSEVVHYLDVYGLRNTFKHGEPGRGWFRNLREHHADLKIPSEKKAEQYRNMPMSEKEWVMEREHLLRSVSGEKVLASKQNIFIIEVNTLHDGRHPHIKFDVMIPYNAQADILLPFVVHNGMLGDKVKHYFRECFAFTHSENGHVDHEALFQCIQYIKRYMRDQELTFPGIVYLQPELCPFFSFACWMWANVNGITICPIPVPVFNWLRPSELGLLTHIMRKMHPYMMKPIYPRTDDPANEHLLNAFFQVLKNGKLLGQISKTFQKLKLLTVKREKRKKCDILHELLGHTKHFQKKPYQHAQSSKRTP